MRRVLGAEGTRCTRHVREPKRMPFFDLDIDPIWAYLSLTVPLSVLMKLVWTLVSTL